MNQHEEADHAQTVRPRIMAWIKTLTAPAFGLITAAWTEFNQQQPIFAAIVGVLAAILLFLGYYLTQFMLKVWASYDIDLVVVFAGWLKAKVLSFAPGFRKHYNQQVIYDNRLFNVRGLQTRGAVTLELEQVFVNLEIAAVGVDQTNENILAMRDLKNCHSIWDYLRKDKHNDLSTPLVIIGAPGCGKTTLLQHVALTLAANRQRRYQVGSYIPIVLALRDHVQTILDEDPSPFLGDLVQRYFSDKKRYPNLSRVPRGWFSKNLLRGKCIVLLDGLDEVAEDAHRKAIARWVDQQVTVYRRCPFVLTARPQGYKSASLEKANTVDVQNFNPQQIRTFIESWYKATKIVSSGKKDAGVLEDARKAAEDLMIRLRNLPALNALTVNPLLLTMIALVHNYRAQLPGRRVELYAEICDVLLSRKEELGVHDFLPAKKKRVVLETLAAHMMTQNTRDIETEDVLQIVAAPLEEVGESRAASRNFLNTVHISGLLREREPGLWCFAHKTFQEYLTSAFWISQKTSPNDWSVFVKDTWWHETLRLYTAQSDATAVVQACLAENTIETLTLATQCLDEALILKAETRRALNERINNALENVDPELRNLAAEVKLQLRLKSLHSDDRCEIDPTYTTWAEYQLFLDASKAYGESYLPDHWLDTTFAPGSANAAVIGIRSEDAEAFIQWLNQHEGGGGFYRLPREAEAKENPAKADMELGTICKEEDGTYRLVASSVLKISATLGQFEQIATTVPIPGNIDLTPSLDLTIDRTPAFDLALGLEMNQTAARVHNRAITRSLELALAFDRQAILDTAQITQRAQAFAHALMPFAGAPLQMKAKDEHSRRLSTLLDEALACSGAQTPIEIRLAQYQYTARILEYICLGYSEMAKITVKRRWWQRLGEEKTDRAVEGDSQAIAEVYWWLQLIKGRLSCMLPTLGSIRIVQEPPVVSTATREHNNG